MKKLEIIKELKRLEKLEKKKMANTFLDSLINENELKKRYEKCRFQQDIEDEVALNSLKYF